MSKGRLKFTKRTYKDVGIVYFVEKSTSIRSPLIITVQVSVVPQRVPGTFIIKRLSPTIGSP